MRIEKFHIFIWFPFRIPTPTPIREEAKATPNWAFNSFSWWASADDQLIKFALVCWPFWGKFFDQQMFSKQKLAMKSQLLPIKIYVSCSDPNGSTWMLTFRDFYIFCVFKFKQRWPGQRIMLIKEKYYILFQIFPCMQSCGRKISILSAVAFGPFLSDTTRHVDFLGLIIWKWFQSKKLFSDGRKWR